MTEYQAFKFLLESNTWKPQNEDDFELKVQFSRRPKSIKAEDVLVKHLVRAKFKFDGKEWHFPDGWKHPIPDVLLGVAFEPKLYKGVRTGNYVIYKGKEHQVLNPNEGGIATLSPLPQTAEPIKTTWVQIQAIPLTKDWFKDLGAKWVWSFWELNLGLNEKLYLKVEGQAFNCYLASDEAELIATVSFVHEVQNIYLRYTKEILEKIKINEGMTLDEKRKANK